MVLWLKLSSKSLSVPVFWRRKICFWHNNVDSNIYLMHPEDIAYENSLDKLSLNDSHIRNIIFTVKLHITVKINEMTRSCVESFFCVRAGSGKEHSRQKVIIFRLKGWFLGWLLMLMPFYGHFWYQDFVRENQFLVDIFLLVHIFYCYC